ncbi:MAG: hypothetical protein JW809_06165 [Pirellulales bacterium]|nr:hypothetical protein [Pirellulales bacterium]
MRFIGWFLLGGVLLAWWLTEVPSAPAPNELEVAAATWRRTAQGWERCTEWGQPLRPTPVRLHPTVLGAFQLLASLTALLASSAATSPRKSGE